MKTSHRALFFVSTLSFAIISIILFVPQASSSTACISGSYTTSLTLTAAQSPICIDDDLQMLNGSSLTIEPGVTLEFSGPHEILIRSEISAVGTEADPIIFKSTSSAAASNAVFLKFFGADLDASTLRHVQFESADIAIQIGEESEGNEGGKNTGKLLVEDVAIDSAEIRTAGYQTTASIDLNRVTLTNASVFGEYPRSEPIVLRNATIQTSTITSDSYSYGITIEDAVVTDSTFRMGCCGANLHLIRADVTDSILEDYNDYYDVEIVDSTLTNTPIKLPWANTININNTTIDARDVTTKAIVAGNIAIEESTIVGSGSGIGVDISGERWGRVGGASVVDSTIVNFETGIKITKSDGFSINGSNLAGFVDKAVDNRNNVDVDATGNYWGTSNAIVIGSLIHDQLDNLNWGLVDFADYLSAPSASAPELPAVVNTLTIAPTVVDLGAVAVGSTATTDVMLYNGGASTIQVSDIAADNSAFTISPTLLTVGAGESQTATVSFTPVVTGLLSADIIITHDATGGSSTISASGTGVSAPCTSIGGLISADTTWTAANSPYCVTSDVQVVKDVTLTIEPDTLIQYEGDHEILVKGTLNAVGTEAQPIVFDGLGKTSRLLFFKDATLPDSSMAHVHFSNADRALQIGDESQDDQVGKNRDTLTIDSMTVISAEIRTAGYESSAELLINDATLINATVFGEYPRSEPITINGASITDSKITSDSYNEGITLNNATISNTELTIGCCGANFTIENSTVIDSSISDYSDWYDIAFRNTTFENTSIALLQAHQFVIEDSVIRHSSAAGLEVGVRNDSGNTAVIRNTLIAGDGTGIGFSLVSGRLAVVDSTIANHEVAIRLNNTRDDVAINGSNLIGNSQYVIENLGTPNVDATGNYFGTTNSSQIASLIFDRIDNPLYGIVDTDSFLTEPSPNAPSATSLPTLQLLTQSVEFGGVEIGDSRTLSVTLLNESSTPIDVTNVQLYANGTDAFSVDSTPFTVPAAASYTLPITFTPSEAGALVRTIAIEHNASGGTVSVALRGVGLELACSSVYGTLTADTVWDNVDQPYCLTDDVFVSADTTLTISPSVKILLTGPYKIVVAGTISADGAPSTPIVFDTIDGATMSGATFLKFKGASLDESTLDHIEFNNAARAIQVGDESQDDNDETATGTLRATNLTVTNSEIRTGGYESSASLEISDSTFISSTILGEHPRSEPITIRNSALSNVAIQSDSYNKGISLIDSAIFDSALTIGCCGANFRIMGSTLVDSSITDYNDSYDVAIVESRLINTAIDLPLSGLYGSVLVDRSTIEHGTSAGVRGSNITVRHSLITGDGSGVGVELMDGSGEVISSTIRSHASGVNILDSTEWDDITLSGNNLYENSGQTSVRNSSRQPIDAKGNYWGTVDSAEIETAIFDYYDDGYYGIVDYSDYLTAATPVPAAPTTGVMPIDPAIGLTMVYTDTEGNTMTLTVPPNAVDQDTLLVYVPLDDVPDRIDSTFANRAFMLLAYRNGMPTENVVFSNPATITLEYDLLNARGASNETLPQLAHWNGEQWTPSACGEVTHNTTTNQLSVEFCSTGQHALFREGANPFQYQLFMPSVGGQ